MIRTTLYFGSFNPVHCGHIAVAEYMIGERLCDELWFVVSPLNPFKATEELADEQDRLAMVRLAVGESPFSDRISVSDVEISIARPSYTIDTLRILGERFCDREFSVLIGSDNVAGLERWKEWEELLRDYKFWCYPRQGSETELFADRVTMLESAPLFDFSSTEVRRAIGRCEDVSEMVCPEVETYIYRSGLWGSGARNFMARGRRHHKKGELQGAMNDFIMVRDMTADNTERAEAEQLIAMIEQIFAFRYLDIYNP